MMSRASSSSSSTQSYDVFMSFRGEDTRTGFTSHLYDALTQKHIRTYKDDRSLEIGNFIAPELLEAIEASRFAIVVLSSNFATSKWCLEEIAKVVDCMERGKLIVIPVFYHVSPTDVRHQSDCFAQGFANHEANPEITPQKVKTWRAAFKRVGDVAGTHVTKDRDESEVVNKIVRKIFKQMQDTLPADVPSGLVGIGSRVNEVKRILSMDPSEVRFIGICGMSGMGKTTLAEIVLKSIQSNFQRSSFIENIKDVSKKNDSTNLCNLQQKLLNEILEDNIDVKSVTHGQTLLGTMLRCFKVIIVLDDVNHVDQLTYLAGSREWFGPGTRIIITTTNNHMLDPHIIDEIYTCEELKCDEALRLFCQSAFKKAHPTHGYEKLTDDMVKLAGGLPLALNVYGSLLCGKDVNYWKEMLKKLQEYPHEEVLGRLETVYARLDRDQRKTFIYIACFLKGRNIHLVKDILTNIGLYPECGIPDLINKFLITINYDDSVWMHDLLQQMCWEVLRKESERHGKHIAIKYLQNVEDILLLGPEGTRTIEIINHESYNAEGVDFFDDHDCFSKMTKLKFLRICKVGFQQGLDRLSNDLRILEWYGCSLKSLPAMFKPRHIFELEMCCSQLETLWEKDLVLPNLRSINLSFSKNLSKIPDLTSTSNLVKLNLEGCTKLTELHESVLDQKRLRYLNLKDCTHLQSLGRSTMEMEALEALLLSGCSSLENIPEFGQNMKCLEHLYIDRTRIKKLPKNLGNMCNLRKLDASETSIEELPSSIQHLDRLRFMRVHKCRLSLKTGGFLSSNLVELSSGLRELDLSYCNLSVLPDGIGLLCHLINLDLSGNDFVSLPASISLLSNLKMLSLDNCKRLKSLPKLSIVNEDTLYGLPIRFSYYISGEELDVSRIHHATSNNTSPTVSCLNCPKLVENGHGSYLAERILNSYLQIRAKYWITPEAVFEIVGAGSIIPSGFNLLRCDEKVILEGPWIGVAICLVIDFCDINACVATKYMVTVHIHVGEKYWKIPVPINFLVAGFGNQLVLYWTAAEDLQRLVDSRQRNNFRFSFSTEPDGNLHVTEFGVRFIRDEDIHQLKRHEDSTNEVVNYIFQDTLFLATDMQRLIRACEADIEQHSCHSIIHDHTGSIIKAFLDHGKQRNILVSVHRVIKCLIEINQEVASACKEEMRHRQLLPLVYDYFRIGRGTSQLYNDFIKLLKEINDNWLSVKLALKQIVAKSRADDSTYKEMLQQLNDLEAAQSVRLSESFLTLFASICKQIVSSSRQFNEDIQGNIKFESVKVFAKASSIAISGVFCVVATYMGDSELLQEMEGITSYSMLLQVIQSFSRRSYKWRGQHNRKASYDRELQIWDFYGNSVLLRELKIKMARFSCATVENKEEIMIIMHKLEKTIGRFSDTIEDMSSDALLYSHAMRQPVITSKQFTAHNSLYRATLSLPADLPWYICACETDHTDLHSIINDRTISIIKFILDYGKQQDLLDGIYKIFQCLQEINQEALPILMEPMENGWEEHVFHLRDEYYHVRRGTFKLYDDFACFLEVISKSWLSIKSAMEQNVAKNRAGDHTYEELLEQLNGFEAAKSVVASYSCFVTSFASLCNQTLSFLRSFNLFDRWSTLMIEGEKNIKIVKVIAQVSMVTITGVFGVLAIYMGDSVLLEDLSGITSNSELLDLIQRFSSNGGSWFDEGGRLVPRIYSGELLVWDFYGSAIVGKLKEKMVLYGCFTQEIEEELLMVIDKLENIINFSERIEDMCRHAYKCKGNWRMSSTSLYSKKIRKLS